MALITLLLHVATSLVIRAPFLSPVSLAATRLAGVQCSATPAASANPADDWGGLPAAIAASRCGAINTQLVKAADAEGVLELVDKNGPALNAVNCATALHRLASHLKRQRVQRDFVKRDRRFAALVAATVERAPSCNPRSVSDVLWACATLGVWPAEMLKPLLTQVSAHLQRDAFEAQHLALVAWAFAVLECKPVVLLTLIEKSALKQLSAFNPQNLANLLWGFAKLKHTPSALLPSITARISEPTLLAKLKPVEIADISFAISVLGSAEEQGALMVSLASLAEQGAPLSRFTSRQLVVLIASFARLDLRPAQLEAWTAAVRHRGHVIHTHKYKYKWTAARLTLGLPTCMTAGTYS